LGGQEANAAVGFDEGPATVGASGGRRWLRYSLTVQGGRSILLDNGSLGSMRVERDFGYAGRVRDSIDAPTFVVDEMKRLAERLGGPFNGRLAPSGAVRRARSVTGRCAHRSPASTARIISG